LRALENLDLMGLLCGVIVSLLFFMSQTDGAAACRRG
jgi:hypothetical protein